MSRRPLISAIALMFLIIALFSFVFNFHSANIIYANKIVMVKSYNIRSTEKSLIEENILMRFENLTTVYRNKNHEFMPILAELRNGLNSSARESEPLQVLWNKSQKWPNKESIFPAAGKDLAQVITAMMSTRITRAENAKKGTQLKLLLTLEGDQKVIFKPKRYEINHTLNSTSGGGSDRHNSEVVGFILALLLDIRLAPVSVIRQIHLKKDVWLLGTSALKGTMVVMDNKMCVYGQCRYCLKKPACADEKSGYLEGAVILFVPGQFASHKTMWRRTDKMYPAKWQNDLNYCKKIKKMLPESRILDLVDAAIFDFLIQNRDRHHHEILNQRVLFLDNGKGLVNPYTDVMEILAPLYQCCELRNSTWERLLLLSGNTLSHSVKTLQKFVMPETKSELITNLQLNALDRRLLKVYATVLYCLETKGSSHVFKS